MKRGRGWRRERRKEGDERDGERIKREVEKRKEKRGGVRYISVT